MSTPSELENPIIEDPFLYYLVVQAMLFDEGDLTVPSEEVQAYLDKTADFTSAVVEKMNIKMVDPRLVDIIENFLYLNDERKKDGSVEQRMLSYHTRVVARLRDFLTDDLDSVETTVNALVGLNFNKPSLVEYFQEKAPVWVAIGDIVNPHPDPRRIDDAHALSLVYEALESIRQVTLPGKAKAYNEQAASLKDVIKATVEAPL